MEMDLADKDQLMVLEGIQMNKLKVAQTYNKHAKKGKNSKNVVSFGKLFYPLKPKIQNLVNGHQIGKAHLS